MIFNTYAMMQSLRHLQDRPLSVDRILEMHRLLMREALDDPSQAGRLRTAEDNVIVQDRGDPTITLHVPPPADELPSRLQPLCDFANARDAGEFLHTTLPSISIHFQHGYTHPFGAANVLPARHL